MHFNLNWKSLLTKFNPRLAASAAAVALTCALSAATYYYRRRSEINEVMIFCKLQLNVFNYFDKLISFIEAAKESVNVCMPSIHNPAIQGRLVDLIKKKNIKVRIVIDGTGFNNSTSTFLKELAEVGAEIKWKVSEYKMQHKFCLIDDKVLMTGTLDWGNDLTCDNWNYVYITSRAGLVEPVKREFYRMWNGCQISVEDALQNQEIDSDNVKDFDNNDEFGNFEFFQENIPNRNETADNRVLPVN